MTNSGVQLVSRNCHNGPDPLRSGVGIVERKLKNAPLDGPGAVLPVSRPMEHALTHGDRPT
jgi:hypothetical protein